MSAERPLFMSKYDPGKSRVEYPHENLDESVAYIGALEAERDRLAITILDGLAANETLRAERDSLRKQRDELLAACKAAKKYLEPDLVEPGRTVFWNLVSAINKSQSAEPAPPDNQYPIESRPSRVGAYSPP
jgi:hypothetical protein